MLSVVWSLGENLAATKEERREAMPREPTSHGHSCFIRKRVLGNVCMAQTSWKLIVGLNANSKNMLLLLRYKIIMKTFKAECY